MSLLVVGIVLNGSGEQRVNEGSFAQAGLSSNLRMLGAVEKSDKGGQVTPLL